MSGVGGVFGPILNIRLGLLVLYIVLVPLETIAEIPGVGTIAKMVAAPLGAVYLGNLLKQGVLKASYTWLAAAIYLLWCFASVLWSLDETAAVTRIITISLLIGLTLVVGNYSFPEREYEIILYAVATSGFIVTILLPFFGQIWTTSTRVTFGETFDPNHMGASLLLPAAACIWWVFEKRNIFLKTCFLVSLLVMLNGFLLIGSRGAFLGLIAIASIMLLMKRKFIILIVAAIIVSSTVIAFWDEPQSRLSVKFAMDTGGAGRTELWEVAFRALEDYWLVGGGIGSFPQIYTETTVYTTTAFTRGLYRATHSLPLTLILETGIVGFLLFFWFFTNAAARVVFKSSPYRDLFIPSLIGLLVDSIFLDTFAYKYLWLAIMLAYATPGEMTAESVTAQGVDTDYEKVGCASG